MYGIFVNETGCAHYAHWLVSGFKTIETRSRDMLAALVGKRVAVICTRRNALHHVPYVCGYVTITGKTFCKAEDFDAYFEQHLVNPWSKYAPNGKGKWFYHVTDAEQCEPYPLPSSAVRHGRSWCEF